MHAGAQVLLFNGDLTKHDPRRRGEKKSWCSTWDPCGFDPPEPSTMKDAKAVFTISCQNGRTWSKILVGKWDGEAFFNEIMPDAIAWTRQVCDEEGKVGVFLIDGEHLQVMYPPGSFLPHRHNKGESNTNDAYAFFGVEEGQGYVRLHDVIDELGFGDLKLSADEMKAKLWEWDAVRNQLTRVEAMLRDAGLGLLVNVPGSPQSAPVERHHRHVKNTDNVINATSIAGLVEGLRDEGAGNAHGFYWPGAADSWHLSIHYWYLQLRHAVVLPCEETLEAMINAGTVKRITAPPLPAIAKALYDITRVNFAQAGRPETRQATALRNALFDALHEIVLMRTRKKYYTQKSFTSAKKPTELNIPLSPPKQKRK